MTTYTLTVRADDGIREISFTRKQLHQVLNALEMIGMQDTEENLEPLIETFTKIIYDWTDWADIARDANEPVLQGSNE